MALIEDLKTKKYVYAAIAVFVIVGGYFAIDAGLIGLVKSLANIFVGAETVVTP